MLSTCFQRAFNARPYSKGLKKTPVYKKGEEALEDIRERWETSDNPAIHRIQDMQVGPLTLLHFSAPSVHFLWEELGGFNDTSLS